MTTEQRDLPSGRVTFAFIDVVGSTRTFQEHGEVYAEALRVLHQRVAQHAETHGGVVVETEGDGAFLAFPDALAAVNGLVGLQAELSTPVGDGLHLALRAGAHTGDAVPVDGHYLALAVYVAARVAGTAGAGQVFVTDEVLAEVREQDGAVAEAATDVGTYSLKDLAEPTRIWRLVGDPVPPRATPARRTNVQQSHTSFIGRDAELTRLRELTARPGLVTVRGPGGTGKTRLVSEFALHEAESCAGGIWLVELATLEDPDQIIGAAGAAVGLTGAALGDVVAELDRRGRCVLVLDNCEHLVDAVSELGEQLLAGCRSLTVLCTSREALALAGERVLGLSPLPVESEATDLFLQRSDDSSGRVLDRDVVHRLCEALDGLPLAIELAASQAGSAPLQEILDEVVAGTTSLARRGGQLRQRSLDAVLDWSLGRLEAADRDSLLVLALVPGRFSPETARALLAGAPGCNPGATKVLARLSLVDLDGEEYRLLSTVRAAALRILAKDPVKNEQAVDALIRWAAAFGEQRFPIITANEDVPDDTMLAVEVALRHGLDRGATGLGKTWDFYLVSVSNRGGSPTAIALTERAAARELVDADSVYQVAAALNLLYYLGQPVPADASRLEEMLAITRRTDDARLFERVHGAMAVAAELAGDLDSARDHRETILRLTETEPAARLLQASAHINLAYNRYIAGDLETAHVLARRAAALAAEHGQWTMYAITNLNMADSMLDAGQPGEARGYALAALHRSQPNWAHRADALILLALAYAALGEREDARASGRLALDLIDRAPMVQPLTEDNLAKLLRAVPELRA